MSLSERYLGGFYSLQMSAERGRTRRTPIGYGVYATSQRLFGLPSGKRPSFDKTIDLMPQNLSNDQNAGIIRELDQSKDFDARKGNISKIELKIPPGLFRTGHLHITLSSGDMYKIHVGRTKPGEQLRDILSAFNSQGLTVI